MSCRRDIWKPACDLRTARRTPHDLASHIRRPDTMQPHNTSLFTPNPDTVRIWTHPERRRDHLRREVARAQAGKQAADLGEVGPQLRLVRPAVGHHALDGIRRASRHIGPLVRIL
eukprot:1676625-Rhodomonas_salina.1